MFAQRYSESSITTLGYKPSAKQLVLCFQNTDQLELQEQINVYLSKFFVEIKAISMTHVSNSAQMADRYTAIVVFEEESR